jgi:hypothetical protein
MPAHIILDETLIDQEINGFGGDQQQDDQRTLKLG